MSLGELTRRAFAAWNERRLDDLLAFFHEDAVWDMRPFGAPGMGAYHGHAGMRRFMAEWLEAFPDSTIEVADVEENGPWTLAIVVQQVSGGASGTPVPFTYAGIGRWREGRLEFVENHPALDPGRAAYEAHLREWERLTSSNVPRHPL